MIVFILFADVLLNFVAWLANQLHIEKGILSHQWENMGYTFVKFTYERLYQERKRSFAYMMSVMVFLLLFFVFLGLRVDGIIHWSWVVVFLPLWITFLIVFQSVPVRKWDQTYANSPNFTPERISSTM